MKLGLFTMPLHPPHRKHADTFDEDMEFVVMADRLGFEEAWIGEHTATTWENIPVPEMFIVQALERTKNIKLGTGVSCIPNHNPAHLAARIAQMDIMAKGRFLWGIGVGATPGDGILFEVDQSGPHRDVSRFNREKAGRAGRHGPPVSRAVRRPGRGHTVVRRGAGGVRGLRERSVRQAVRSD